MCLVGLRLRAQTGEEEERGGDWRDGEMEQDGLQRAWDSRLRNSNFTL